MRSYWKGEDCQNPLLSSSTLGYIYYDIQVDGVSEDAVLTTFPVLT